MLLSLIDARIGSDGAFTCPFGGGATERQELEEERKEETE